MEDQKMQLVDWLDDLCVRFIVNLPQEELESVARICFQIEEAQWYYEDFIRPIDPTLPSMNLKQFSLKILAHCPLTSSFSDEQYLLAYEEFLGYKTRVPVRGAIMLNAEMDHVLLVKGWSKSASWSFPRGKINKDEDDLDCAIREVWEETGFDISAAGLVPERDSVKAIDITMRDQNMRLFVFRGVPMDTPFEPKTRKEISKIQWYRLNDLPTMKRSKGNQSDGGEAYSPNRFYMVAPFLQPLKRWITKQHKVDAQSAANGVDADDLPSEAFVEEQPASLPEPTGNINGNATSELRRLFNVQPSQASMEQVSKKEQASQLLAILNGGAKQPMVAPAEFPQGSMEQQILSPPRQTANSHVSHVQPSLFGLDQPAPQLPAQALSAQSQLYAQQQAGLDPHFPSMQQQAHVRHTPQLHDARIDGFDQSERVGQRVATQPLSRQLDKHAMNLLSAFTAGPGATRSITNPILPPSSTSLDPPQTALLDIFKTSQAPSRPNADLGSKSIPTSTTAAGHTVKVDKTTSGVPPSAPRRPSAMSMITRALPKSSIRKAVASLPAPKLDEDNFPILVSTTTAPKAVARKDPPLPKSITVPPAEHPTAVPVRILARPAQPPASAFARPPSRTKLSASPQPVSLLQRQEAAGKRVASTRQRKVPAPLAKSPLKSPTKSPAKPTFQPQILKRGEPAPADPETTAPVPAATPAAAAPSPPPATDLEQRRASAAQVAKQRNTLLSLFAQTQEPKAQSPLLSGIISPTSPFSSPPATGTKAGFIPPQVLSRSASQNPRPSTPGAIGSERAVSRQGSWMGGGGGTMTGRQSSLGGESLTTVLKSPGTPVEARGFLMEYLDGVVKGAK